MSPAVALALSFVVPALKVTAVGCVLVWLHDDAVPAVVAWWQS